MDPRTRPLWRDHPRLPASLKLMAHEKWKEVHRGFALTLRVTKPRLEDACLAGEVSESFGFELITPISREI